MKTISFVIVTLILMSSCGRTLVDYVSKEEFVFNNQTEHTLQFKARDTMRVILPQSKNNVITITGIGPEKLYPEQATKFTLLNLFRNYDFSAEEATLCIGDTCVLVKQKGFAQISNYQSKALNDRHIRYTYTFTNAEIDELLK